MWVVWERKHSNNIALIVCWGNKVRIDSLITVFSKIKSKNKNKPKEEERRVLKMAKLGEGLESSLL